MSINNINKKDNNTNIYDNKLIQQKKSSSAEHSKKFKSDMMKLLIASMKNINPLQQTDISSSMNMASMIISVEQGQAQVDAMERLEQVIRNTNNSLGADAALFNTDILIDGNKVSMHHGNAHFSFKMKDGVKTPVFQIIDETGDIVFSESIKPSSTEFTWRGVDGQEPAFYNNLKARIIEESEDGDTHAIATEKFSYYTRVKEIFIAENADEKYAKTHDEVMIPLNKITGIRQTPSTSNPYSASAEHLIQNATNNLMDIIG